MTVLEAHWVSGGVSYGVLTTIRPQDDFDAKFAEHKANVAAGLAAHPPDE